MLAAAAAAIPEPAAEPLRACLLRAEQGVGPANFVHQEGWVLIAFQNAFRHLAAGTPIEAALIATVGQGGDTDTNAAICGALLGAMQGCGSIPPRWVIRVLAARALRESGARQPRPARYWPIDIFPLAEALLETRGRGR